MPRRNTDKGLISQAVANSAGGAAAVIAATKIDGTGYSRARFIFNFSNAATTASLSTGFGVWQAATSGATYAIVTSGVAVTSGIISGSANPVIVIDIPIVAANPWLQLSGSFIATTPAHGAVVELYSGINRPSTHTEQQVIVL